jgi:phage baseplate assembly protein W
MALKRTSPGLRKNTLATGKTNFYSDIDLTFTAKPGSVDENGVRTGDIYKKGDTAAVLQAVENILLTNTQEKPFEPSFGGNLRQMLFNPSSAMSASFVSGRIMNAIERWEPRCEVKDVKFFVGSQILDQGLEDFRAYVNNEVRIQIELLIDNEGFITTVNMSRLR